MKGHGDDLTGTFAGSTVSLSVNMGKDKTYYVVMTGAMVADGLVQGTVEGRLLTRRFGPVSFKGTWKALRIP